MTTAAQFLTILTAEVNRLAIMEVDLDFGCAKLDDKVATESFELQSSSSANKDPPDIAERKIIMEAVNPTPSRRSGRHKPHIQLQLTEPRGKRRVIKKPKKLVEDSGMKEIHNYYLNKKVKRLPPSLETIFEEPQNDMFMSARKFKRTLLCYNPVLSTDRNKVRKRSLKAKKVCTIKKLNKKIAMDLLMKKLSVLESTDED